MTHIGPVLQPWQIHEVVNYVLENFYINNALISDSYCNLPLGNRLVGIGLIISTGNCDTSIDFNSIDDLWFELCKKNVAFTGIWSMVFDRAIKRANLNEGSLSLFYDFAYILARDTCYPHFFCEDNACFSFYPSILCQRLNLDVNLMRQYIRDGVSERPCFNRKRKYPDIEYEINLIFGN